MKPIITSVSFSTKHPIADVETKTVIPYVSVNGAKKPDCHNVEINVAGFFVDNAITQFRIVDESELDIFRNQIRDFLSTINGKQLHAFFIDVEKGCFENLLGNSPAFAKIEEIMPFKGKKKEYLFSYLVANGEDIPISVIPPEGFKENLMEEKAKDATLPVISINGFPDPYNGDSRKCIGGNIEDTGRHNVCCLLKEAIILSKKDFFNKEFGHRLNKGRFLNDDVLLPSEKIK